MHIPILRKTTISATSENINNLNILDHHLIEIYQIFCLYVFIMSRTHFKVNQHYIVARMSRNSLLITAALSDI